MPRSSPTRSSTTDRAFVESQWPNARSLIKRRASRDARTHGDIVALDANALLRPKARSSCWRSSLPPTYGPLHGRARTPVPRRAAPVRCRQLGASFSGIAGTRLRLRTGVETYGRDGTFTETQLAGSAVKVTT
jgi:hypothetical protein